MALPLPTAPGAAALQRPELSIGIAQAAASGLASFGASLLGAGASDPWQRSTIALRVSCGLAPCADRLSIDLVDDAHAPEVAVGDTGSIQLGYAGELEPVFEAEVDQIEHGVIGVRRLGADNGSGALCRLRINQAYEQTSAGAVVRDLAAQAEVGTDAIEDGIELPYYVVDDRSHAYQHIAELAKKSGLIAYFTPAGKLAMAAAGSGEVQASFRYGADILQLQLRQGPVLAGEFRVVGEGAAGGSGEWHWLLVDPAAVSETAGEGASGGVWSDPALRSAAAVRSHAAARLARSQTQATRARLLVPGAPAVTVGGLVEIADAPASALNGKYWVAALTHRYDKRGGFVTQLELRAAGGGGSGLGAVGALL